MNLFRKIKISRAYKIWCDGLVKQNNIIYYVDSGYLH